MTPLNNTALAVSTTSSPPAASAQKSISRPPVTQTRTGVFGFALLLGVTVGMVAQRAEAGGTWVKINNAPPGGLDNPLLMTDGTVLCGNGGSTWYKYKPDSVGNYLNGTWTTMASSAYTRLFFSSQVLPNGNVYVAGGEYGTGTKQAELYNYLSNSWSTITPPSGNPTFSDAISMLLPNGNVLQGSTGSGCWIYNVSTNSFSTAASAPAGQDETAWVRLPNDNILTIDNFSQNAYHYVPANNAWYTDGTTPSDLFGYGGEMGAGFVLPNGKAFYIGGTSTTAIYTPGSTLTGSGSWVAGAAIPNSLGAIDAPAAMLTNGKILCALGTNTGYGSTSYFYEYDYTNDTFTQVTAPGGGTSYATAEYGTAMVQLPDGGVFYVGGQGSTSCYIYYPDGSPLAQGTPTVSSYVMNSDGSYTLTGVGFSGISHGAAYGDDWQMNTNYPIVRLTNSAGGVYYARTYNWSNTAVQNPNTVTTQFTLPSGLPSGSYSLQVVVNGNASANVAFKTGGGVNTALYEAEALTVNSSTDTVSASGASQYSGGSGDILYANAVGDSVVYLVPNVAAGTYTVSVGMKQWTNRATIQLSGSRADQNTYTNIGSSIDEYNANGSGIWTEVTVGTWVPGTTNDKLFKFAVTGKNANSAGYDTSIDYIRLTAAGSPPTGSKETAPKGKAEKSPAKQKSISPKEILPSGK